MHKHHQTSIPVLFKVNSPEPSMVFVIFLLVANCSRHQFQGLSRGQNQNKQPTIGHGNPLSGPFTQPTCFFNKGSVQNSGSGFQVGSRWFQRFRCGQYRNPWPIMVNIKPLLLKTPVYFPKKVSSLSSLQWPFSLFLQKLRQIARWEALQGSFHLPGNQSFRWLMRFDFHGGSFDTAADLSCQTCGEQHFKNGLCVLRTTLKRTTALRSERPHG